MNYPRISALKGVEAFRSHIASLKIELNCDDEIITGPKGPLSWQYRFCGKNIGNRFCIHPMEGWDATRDGKASDFTRRRWSKFGESGAKLVWGGEAFAVTEKGKANPNQLIISDQNRSSIAELRQILLDSHLEKMGRVDDLFLGLQLTHSGRFCRPFRKDKMEPAILYHHPLLDSKFGIDESYPVLNDGEIQVIIDNYIYAAKIAWELGYDFVDIKHCHGYLGHEFLSAHRRSGRFGGSFENRTRFLSEIVSGIRAEVPQLAIGIRLSAFDKLPFKPDPKGGDSKKLGKGIPEFFDKSSIYEYGFGLNKSDPLEIDLSETMLFLTLLEKLDIRLVNISCGSPYYNPHIQRPALFPPSDGYQPPEDPLVGVARQINVVSALKSKFQSLCFVGSGYSYLQEFLPYVGQKLISTEQVDFIGLGRMILSYPELPRDVVSNGEMKRKLICRTFSDCTTAPRNGIISGCFPLDKFYKNLEQAKELRDLKSGKSR